MKLTRLSCLMAMCMVCNVHADDVSPQVQRLLAEKQQKIAELEQCDGKRKGFMIAGISTIGMRKRVAERCSVRPVFSLLYGILYL